MDGKLRNTAIELVLQQLMLQIKQHIFHSPFYRTFANLIRVNQIKIIRLHESSSKLYSLQRIVKVYPFKDGFNIFLLNVAMYCPSAIIELFTNLSY